MVPVTSSALDSDWSRTAADWNNTKSKRVFGTAWDDPANLPFMTMKATALGTLVIWTIAANVLVFVVLYKNPRLQTVPNFLVGNLALSDLCLGIVVLPLAAVYAVTLRWSFGKNICEIWLSSDILCSTASIWNLSIIGLDRYWAITSPITYITKRTMRSAVIMIVGVWGLSMLISVAPFFGWRNLSEMGNYVYSNDTLHYQCVFLDLPAYCIYSATGSFVIPLAVMFFVYFQIYRAFAEHKARHLYRQKVLKKHIESTILHEISHVFPIPMDELDDKEEEEEEDEEDSEEDSQSDEENEERKKEVTASPVSRTNSTTTTITGTSKGPVVNGERAPLRHGSIRRSTRRTRSLRGSPTTAPVRQSSNAVETANRQRRPLQNRAKSFTAVTTCNHVRRPLVQENKHKTSVQSSQYKKREHGTSTRKKPNAISAAKEKRGVKVLGIILGCFTVCWTPFFIMYFVTGLCQKCRPNAHVEQFITWLGYSNSAMNPIIYTVFNRDYQMALKRLFSRGTSSSSATAAAKKRRPQAV